MADKLAVSRGLPACPHCHTFNWVTIRQASTGEHLLCRQCNRELWPIGVVRVGSESAYVYPLHQADPPPTHDIDPGFIVPLDGEPRLHTAYHEGD